MGNGSREFRSRQDDYSAGVVGNISTEGLAKIKHLALVTNGVFRPHRSVSSRGGTRDLINAVIQEEPLSIGKFYNVSGNKTFISTIGGHIERIGPSTFARQTTPTMTGQKMKMVSANGLLVAQQKGALAPPMFFSQTNAADTWLTMVLPKPVAAAASVVTGAGGNLTASTTYYYRLRWRYRDGSSKSGPVFSGATAAANGTLTITHADLLSVGAGPSGRTDYLGWTLERTKATGTSAGPFYWITDGSAVGPYADTAADSGLGGIFARTTEAIHGEPPNFNGAIYHKNRLFGWVGSSLYVSQSAFGDDEATGIANWPGDAIYDFDKDDGDEIQTCVIQSDRIVVFKRTSTHVLEGDDADSFRKRKVADVGAAGYRAAYSDGSVAYFMSGDAMMFAMKGDRPIPFGFVEVGHYLAQADLTMIEDALVVGQGGDFIHFALTLEPNDHNSDVLSYDLVERTWTHHDLCMNDAIMQKDGADFSRAQLIYVDPVKRVAGAAKASGLNSSFLVWSDGSADAETNVQRLTPGGVAAWTAGGVQLSNSINMTEAITQRPVVVHDGSTGIIAAWCDRRNGTKVGVYAQHLTLAATQTWTANGVVIGNAGTTTTCRMIHSIPDGLGGAFIAWCDDRSGVVLVYVQHVNSSGAVLWAVDGVRPSTQTAVLEQWPRLLRDATTGVYLLWNHGGGGSAQIMLQHLDASGSKLAGVAATSIATGSGADDNGAMVADGEGGVIAAYAIVGTGALAKRCGSSGATVWGPISLDSLTLGSSQPLGVCSDGSGGAFVFLNRPAPGFDVRVNRVQRDGVVISATPTLIHASPGAPTTEIVSTQHRTPHAVPFANGDALVVWVETNPGITSTVWTARVDKELRLIWKIAARPVAGLGAGNPAVAVDGDGGAIVVWDDATDVYAARIRPDTTLPWGASGQVSIASGAATQRHAWICFTGAPESFVPDLNVPGFHAFAAFGGATDYADASGLNGQQIAWEVERPYIDDGAPDTLKEYSRVEAHVELTSADVTATLQFDEASPPASVNLGSSIAGLAKWDDGVSKWDDGVSKWQGAGRLTLESGLEMGTSAKHYSLRLSALLSESIKLSGSVVDGFFLEDRRY